MKGRELLIRQGRVSHPPMQQPLGQRSVRLGSDQGRLGPTSGCIIQKGMAIKLLPNQGHKQGTGLQATAVGAHRAKRFRLALHPLISSETCGLTPELHQLAEVHHSKAIYTPDDHAVDCCLHSKEPPPAQVVKSSAQSKLINGIDQ